MKLMNGQLVTRLNGFFLNDSDSDLDLHELTFAMVAAALDETGRTLALERAFVVDADAATGARVVETLVHVTANIVHELVAERAQTPVRPGRVDALDRARTRRALIHVYKNN